jgi:hypothetical protein
MVSALRVTARGSPSRRVNVEHGRVADCREKTNGGGVFPDTRGARCSAAGRCRVTARWNERTARASPSMRGPFAYPSALSPAARSAAS